MERHRETPSNKHQFEIRYISISLPLKALIELKKITFENTFVEVLTHKSHMTDDEKFQKSFFWHFNIEGKPFPVISPPFLIFQVFS